MELSATKFEFKDEGEQRRFQRELLDVLYDEGWCSEHRIEYTNPDVGRAKIIFYAEWRQRNLFQKGQ